MFYAVTSSRLESDGRYRTSVIGLGEEGPEWSKLTGHLYCTFRFCGRIMASACTSIVPYLVTRGPWSSGLGTRRRISLRSAGDYRSTLTRLAGQHGTRYTLPLGAVVQCSSLPPDGSSSSFPSSTMRELWSNRSTIQLKLDAETTSEAQPGRIVFPSLKLLAGCVLTFAVSYGFHTKAALAVAESSIAASGLGIKVATFLRGSGWPDWLIVFTVAMLPVLELRGAIPISYWLNVDPIKGFILAVLGNMVPVPLIVLYLGKLSRFLEDRSPTGRSPLTWLLEKTRKKGGVIEEFQWLGLMLFVAVPFPGTGAWTGAFIAALMGMPFWEAMTANFWGVVIAGLLVNLVVTLGARYAVLAAAVLFVISSFMWNALRLVQNKNKDAT